MLRHAVPAALRAPAPASTRPQVVGIGIDFTACTVLPTLADGTPLCEVPELRDRPHAYVKLWKHHAAQPHADRINALAHERGEPWIAPVRREDLRRVAVRQGVCSCWRRTRRSTHRARALDRGGRLDRLAAVRGRDPQRLHRRLQGHLPGRPVPVARTTWPRSTRTSPDFVAKLDRPLSPLGGRAGGLTAQAAAWTGLPEGIAVAVANVDAHVTAAAAQALQPGPAGRHHGHLDLPRHQRRRRWPRCRACAVWSTAASAPGAWGYEAGQSGVGDIFGWFVEHAAPAGVRLARAR